MGLIDRRPFTVGAAIGCLGLLGLVAIISFVAVVYSFFGRSEGLEERPISEVFTDAKAGLIDEIIVSGNTLTIRLSGEDLYRAKKEAGVSILELLKDEGVAGGGSDGLSIRIKDTGGFGWVGVAITILPLLLFMCLIVMVFMAGWWWGVRRS